MRSSDGHDGRVGRIGLAAAVAVLSLGAGVLPASAQGTRIWVDVSRECTAPEPPMTNACSLRGIVVGAGVGGTDLEWEVTLFANDAWRIQFQAFSEDVSAECQYPVRVWGSTRAGSGRSARFVSTSGIDLGVTPTDHPLVTLEVDRLRIDTERPQCG